MNKKHIVWDMPTPRALRDSEVDLFFYVDIVKTKSQDLFTKKT